MKEILEWIRRHLVEYETNFYTHFESVVEVFQISHYYQSHLKGRSLELIKETENQ